ncbi:CDP-diacylglycerol---serine O-phosphatidyltransferase [Hathewaya proteolytica DSM 3090]|uniref:CDP-diacylglycerol--serine O-phosphatidyltransferase n=1 Tax=Hathewaya proteolytica DSM 3090 TaxID=1121331 RepID=A0A1M6NA97_9CLOT|nr:CDP-diacylglycerol--serine O-phosphatidyltransferase [Hathewaya proteolytica]SHJ92625.1 CDP-diacylglycerol---serine O-phosphatidyltransferase [Hathewaya proteolytica DSM 3090]
MSKSFIPNALTFSNLTLGIISILMTIKENYFISSIAVLSAALIDRYDGKIARFFDASSEIGKELDSLADLVSFGVAPSILLYFIYNFENLGIISYALIIVFPICGAYRLAKFNISTFDNVYTGIPITVAGAALALYCLLTYNTPLHICISITVFLLLAYLMVSKVKFKKI